MRTGIVSGLLFEARAVVGKAAEAGRALPHPSGQTWVQVAGIGPERARAAAESLIAQQGVEVLLSWGTCAGLVAGVSSGALVVPRQIRSGSGTILETDPGLQAALVRALGDLADVKETPLAEATEVVESVRAKQALAERSGAAAVDMESAAVARVAREAGVAFVAVRAVIDPHDQALPKAVLALSDAYGRIRWSRLPGCALRHGRTLGRLARQSSRATRTLTTVAAPVRTQLEAWAPSG
ncbi:MAG: phosphorylase [Opitutales bacterium]